MDFQRMNTLAITILLGGFAMFMLFLLGIMSLVQEGHPPGKDLFYPLLVVAGFLVLFCGLYAVRAVGGEKSPVRGSGANRIFQNYIHKDTPRTTRDKFLVIFLIAVILGVVISPKESLERTILTLSFFILLIWLFVSWALEYDPLPPPGQDMQDYFTPAERDDPLTREVVMGLPADVAFGYCLDAIHTVWGRLVKIDTERERGTIDYQFANSRLSFVLTPVGDARTRVWFSITNDLPRKWNPDIDRRQNIRYLDRILAELKRRAQVR